MKKFGEIPEVSSRAKKEIEDILGEYGKNLEKSAFESEGFLYVPADHIKIIPPTEGMESGVVEIYEPEEKVGTEEFDLRTKFDMAYPVGDVSPFAEWENQVFDGEITPEPFSPEVGGRICFTNVNIYETKEESCMLMPIHPKLDKKYQIVPAKKEQSKLSGTSMLRGSRFPKASEIVSLTRSKVTHNLTELQKLNPEERIISRPAVLPTGLWTIRVFNKKGKYSEIKNCHIQRDPSTGTLDVISIQKQFIFEGFENFHPRENLPLGLERITALVSLNKLKRIQEGEPLELERLYYAGKEIQNLEDLPENYQSMFEKKEGKFFQKIFRATPPLQSFLKLEKRMLEETPEDLEGDIRQKIGELFENLVARVLEREKNQEELHAIVPKKETLETLLQNQPDKFKEWARALSGREIIVRPDFVLEDGTFVEVKSGLKTELKPEKREQVFRMVLYNLIKEQAPKIRIIKLEGETIDDPVFEYLHHENIFDTELAKKITERDLKPIKMWQKYLPK